MVVYQPSMQEEPDKEKSKGSKVAKAAKQPKGKTVATPSATPASQGTITTRSATKATVQASAAPTPTVVGSPSVLLAPSHSGATAPAFTRKRKALAAATSVTSSEGTSTYTLIENVYMGDLMEHFNKTKTPHEAFLRIEEFLVKVRVISFCIVPICFLRAFLFLV
jgi:hypothetical protein